MSTFSADVAAVKAGVDRREIERLTAMGMLTGDDEHGYTESDVRRVAVVGELVRAGLPVDEVAGLIRTGSMSLDFLDIAGGRTVNLAARIGEFARPGEVLVSREVVDIAEGLPVTFRSIGPVALEGISGLLELFAAEAAPAPA